MFWKRPVPSPLPRNNSKPTILLFIFQLVSWSCCSPHLGFDLPSRAEQRASSVILVLSSRSREKINRWGFYCVRAGVWSSCFALNISCLESNSGLCPRVNTKFLLSPPQNHIRFMDPLDSKKYPGAAKFFILFSILHQPSFLFCH